MWVNMNKIGNEIKCIIFFFLRFFLTFCSQTTETHMPVPLLWQHPDSSLKITPAAPTTTTTTATDKHKIVKYTRDLMQKRVEDRSWNCISIYKVCIFFYLHKPNLLYMYIVLHVRALNYWMMHLIFSFDQILFQSVIDCFKAKFAEWKNGNYSF